MTNYFFTEIISFYPELKDRTMSHMETSHWFRDNAKSIRKENLCFMSSKFMNYIRDGFMVNRHEVNDGIITSRHLWKESAWLQYQQELTSQDNPEQYKNRCNWALGMEPSLIRYVYHKIDEDQKVELIKLYFMDYFVD